MAVSKRKLIRQYAQNLLTEGDTPAEGRVYPHRGQLTDRHQTPCYLVHTPEEEAEPRNKGMNRLYLRELVLEVAAIAIDTPELELEDALDDMAQAAEELLLADLTMGGLTGDVFYLETKPQLGPGGAVLPGACRVRFVAHYYT